MDRFSHHNRGWPSILFPALACACLALATGCVSAQQERLPLKGNVSQYGITWTFERPAPVGQFANGDYYVVGPVTVKAIDPSPVYGEGNEDRARNGAVLNLPAGVSGADGRVDNYFRADAMARLPVAMKPGDSLVSTISGKPGERVELIVKGSGRPYTTNAVVKDAAVLTCMGKQVPRDAFRPAFVDKTNKVYLARNMKRHLLPSLPRPKSVPKMETVKRYFERPWADTAYYGFASPVANMPTYGREVARVVGIGGLMLCCDFPAEQKETLLIRFVQVGIDLWGMAENGHAGWFAHGGHHNGRKWPIIFAGIMLGDDRMANPNRIYPDLKFQEDMQTLYGKSWTGAGVVYGGHMGPDHDQRVKGWGAFEHLHPSRWEAALGEGYRRCCTGVCWPGEALACRLMGAMDNWDHPAFFDYVDRWMTPDDPQLLAELVAITGGKGYAAPWAVQGQTWDDFVNDMWAMYRHRKP